jgi:hypothetical protein
VLIGHGTFDGRDARFGLTGPDFTAAELRQWLSPLSRPCVVVNCTSASGPFVETLSGPGRVVVAATKNGYEHNFCRFGEFFSSALDGLEADLDKDGQASVLEAFLLASRRTEEHYQTAGRLATEHAVLDDNGDGHGVRADQFRGVRPVESGAVADGVRANQIHLVPGAADRGLTHAQRQRRDELELAVVQLRSHKAEWPQDEYLVQLESVLTELALLYETAEPPAVAE